MTLEHSNIHKRVEGRYEDIIRFPFINAIWLIRNDHHVLKRVFPLQILVQSSKISLGLVHPYHSILVEQLVSIIVLDSTTCAELELKVISTQESF